jgi:SAM-dependent methyltransferase
MAVIARSDADQVVAGYAPLAPYYDAFTADYDYETWADGLESLAAEHGLRGRRLLDVGCGTGKSFLPFLARGYRVTACDISPAMIAAASRKLPPGAARLLVADMRELPDLGRFDLITCLDDTLNYLLEREDLVVALRGMRRCLAHHGLLVFDCNSRATYRTAFRSQFIRETDDLFFSWRGDGSADNGLASATIDIFAHGDGSWNRSTSRHVQRHHSRETVEDALWEAGLEPAAVRGQSPGCRLEMDVDEEVHTKFVYLARRARRKEVRA